MIVCTAILCACNTVKPVPLALPVITQTQYVIKIPPAELMTLPAKVKDINVDTATQAEVAQWLIDNEKYTTQCTNQLKDIAVFFVTQQNQLNGTAAVQNAQQNQAAQDSYNSEAEKAAEKAVNLNAQPVK